MFATTRQLLAVAPFGLLLLAGQADAQDSLSSDKRSLAGAQAYVGTWRGVGQPKRGSNQGAWTEESSWAWRFHGGRAAIWAQLTGNKYYSALELQPGNMPGTFVLLGTASGDGDARQARSAERFTGRRTQEGLVLTADEPQSDRPARISLRLVAGGDRMLVLYEQRVGEGAYARMAEVGSTRAGSAFAKSAASGPECVVTGGLGTIAVQHQGKKYFVCCSGCRDYFLDDPAGVLAEYRQRKAAEQAERKK